MNPTTNTTINKESEARAIIEAAQASVEIDKRHAAINGVPVGLINGDLRVLTSVLEAEDARAAAPRRLRGTAKHTTLESFIGHVDRFKDEHSALWADDNSITCIFDYHAPRSPRWGQHRAIYTAPLSPQWKLWTGAADKLMSQDAFGDLLDLNLGDIAAPQNEEDRQKGFASPSVLANIARSLQITARKFHERKLNPSTGEQTLVFREEHEESSTKIPPGFLLGIPVFVDGKLYRVEARLRIKVDNGVKFGFLLPDDERILRDAYGEVRKQVAAATALPLFVGSPE